MRGGAETAPGFDAFGVGRPIPGAVGGEQRGAGALAHGQGTIPAGDHGRNRDPHIRKVVIMSAAQIGKTDAFILNPLGYYMDYAPAPILVMQPTLDMGQTFSKDRLAPMIRTRRSCGTRST